jgi:IS5 family transposase
MRVIEELGVDSEAHSVRKAGKPVFGYKQHTVADSSGVVMAAATTIAANCHDSNPLLGPRQKPISSLQSEPVFIPTRHIGQKHHAALKTAFKIRPLRTIH